MVGFWVGGVGLVAVDWVRLDLEVVDSAEEVSEVVDSAGEVLAEAADLAEVGSAKVALVEGWAAVDLELDPLGQAASAAPPLAPPASTLNRCRCSPCSKAEPKDKPTSSISLASNEPLANFSNELKRKRKPAEPIRDLPFGCG